MVSPNPPTQPVAVQPTNPAQQVTATTATISASTGALVGVLIWVLDTYVFHGSVPGPLQAVLPIVAGGLVALGSHIWTVFTHLTDKK